MPLSFASYLTRHMGRSTVSPSQDVDARSSSIRIALVTSFPPSRGDLNEYGYHLACALRGDPGVELVILADEVESDERTSGFQIKRCWRFNSVLNPARLLWTIWKTHPDVVWFNIGFSTFAWTPLAAFLGITIPALARIVGYYTHVTLHCVFERISLRDAGLHWPGLYRLAGRVATHLLLLADDVSVLLPSLASDLRRNYGAIAQRVQFRPHGTFAGAPSQQLSQSRDKNVILAFGYWGTYKRLDLLLEAMDEIVSQVPNATLVVAGTNHPRAPGYLESLQQRWLGCDHVSFRGYVTEEELPALFKGAGVLVLPYSSTAGASGVVYQACQYGLPMVAADIPELVDIAHEEEIAIEFYPRNDRHALASQLIRVLTCDDLRRRMFRQNVQAAQKVPMSQVADGYLRLFRERVFASHVEVTIL